MLYVVSLIKLNLNGLTQSCKIVQIRQGKIEVQYANCTKKYAFWLDESNPNINSEIHAEKCVPSTTHEYAKKKQ